MAVRSLALKFHTCSVLFLSPRNLTKLLYIHFRLRLDDRGIVEEAANEGFEEEVPENEETRRWMQTEEERLKMKS